MPENGQLTAAMMMRHHHPVNKDLSGSTSNLVFPDMDSSLHSLLCG
jgi:hypothetical protein